MGYCTRFSGSVGIIPHLKPEHEAYLEKFCESRRMKRDPIAALTLEDPTRAAVGLPLGKEGEYFVGSRGDFGQDRDASILHYNKPPASQPSLWCNWIIYRDRIEGPDDSKFYGYVEWLAYMIGHFFEPWGYKLNGEIEWRGEDRDDEGMIAVEDNKIAIYELKREFVINDYSSGDAMERVRAAQAARAANMIGAPNMTSA